MAGSDQTCRTCRFWQPAIKALAHLDLSGRCERFSVADGETPSRDAGLIAMDDHCDFATEVSTKPDFGCLQWEDNL